MAVAWNSRCSASGAAICVAGNPNEGCEIVPTDAGNKCVSHYRGDGGDDPLPDEGGNFSKYELMVQRGELCRNAKTL